MTSEQTIHKDAYETQRTINFKHNERFNGRQNNIDDAVSEEKQTHRPRRKASIRKSSYRCNEILGRPSGSRDTHYSHVHHGLHDTDIGHQTEVNKTNKHNIKKLKRLQAKLELKCFINRLKKINILILVNQSRKMFAIVTVR